MTSYNNRNWITTREELEKVLTKCSECYSLTFRGNFIISFDELQSIKLSSDQEKRCIVINTVKSDGNEKVGHWILLYINMHCRQAILIDSLDNVYKTRPRVMTAIKLFCEKFQLKFRYLKLKSQTSNSLACGVHVLWFIHICHKLNIKAVLKLGEVLSNYSVKNIEDFIVQEVFNHFKL